MIYCVEDDKNIRELIIYTLESMGFGAKGFEEYSSLYSELKKEKPELILLDVMLPNKNGLSILKELRNKPETKEIPIIMLTAKDSEFDKVKAFDIGADDYITKPFGMMELISRIKALLRRTTKKETNNIEFNGIVLDKENYQAFIDGEEIKLTLKEFNLLNILIQNKNKVLSRDRLTEMIWGYNMILESRSLDVHIGVLRSKLKDKSTMIKTVRGIGYKISEVK